MKALLMIAGLLVATTAAYAMPKDMECGKEAWKAASPTDEQNKAAEANMAPVKKMFMDNKDAIHADVAALKAAFAAHPIVKADVGEAGNKLFTLVMPIQRAAINAIIDTINLLSADQRVAFDASMKACHEKNHGGDHDLSGIDWEPIHTANAF